MVFLHSMKQLSCTNVISRLPDDVPAKIAAVSSVKKRRLKKKAADGKVIKPLREKAQQILKDMGLNQITRDTALTHSSLPPWKWKFANIQFNNVLDGCTSNHDSAENNHAVVNKLMFEIRYTDLV